MVGHPEGILDQHVRMLFAEEDSTDADSLPEGVFEEPKADAVEVEHWHRRAGRDIFWGTRTLSPLWNDTFRGYAAISQDTTTTKERERLLERQNDRQRSRLGHHRHRRANRRGTVRDHRDRLTRLILAAATRVKYDERVPE